jgi:hypothetical protein
MAHSLYKNHFLLLYCLFLHAVTSIVCPNIAEATIRAVKSYEWRFDSEYDSIRWHQLRVGPQSGKFYILGSARNITSSKLEFLLHIHNNDNLTKQYLAANKLMLQKYDYTTFIIWTKMYPITNSRFAFDVSPDESRIISLTELGSGL